MQNNTCFKHVWIGARGIQFMFRTLIFRILPTFFELVAVTFIFSNLFTPFVSLALVLAAALYIGFTITWVEVKILLLFSFEESF